MKATTGHKTTTTQVTHALHADNFIQPCLLCRRSYMHSSLFRYAVDMLSLLVHTPTSFLNYSADPPTKQKRKRLIMCLTTIATYEANRNFNMIFMVTSKIIAIIVT
mmetsp:Transcript_9303/g.14297  ORF Transcript_9303/g.14297 Transcript_9303/m.14297 type:complete len:106 (-) Transcript_9303:1200-1517(-)